MTAMIALQNDGYRFIPWYLGCGALISDTTLLTGPADPLARQ